jgi:hypothetical protein
VFADVQIVGVDETSLRRGQNYITVVHDLDAKRLLFATEGRSHQTVLDFAADLKAHGGDPAEVKHVCMDMSAAYAKGAALGLPQAQISYDRFHVVAMAIEAMDVSGIPIIPTCGNRILPTHHRQGGNDGSGSSRSADSGCARPGPEGPGRRGGYRTRTEPGYGGRLDQPNHVASRS